MSDALCVLQTTPLSTGIEGHLGFTTTPMSAAQGYISSFLVEVWEGLHAIVPAKHQDWSQYDGDHNLLTWGNLRAKL